MQAPRAAARVELWNLKEREAAIVRPAQFVVGNDDEFEEPEELRKVTVGRALTERQRREHEGENHSVHREWCEVCVAAWHWSATPTSTKETSCGSRAGSRIFSDVCFMSPAKDQPP